ncbi:MAG: hypothetical protein WD649_04545 [Thermoleophilaceae bacterium]
MARSPRILPGVLAALALCATPAAAHERLIGADFGFADTVHAGPPATSAPAFAPSAKAVWAGTCDLADNSTALGGAGTPPEADAYAHCIDHNAGVGGDGFGGNGPMPALPPGLDDHGHFANPGWGSPPSWRLDPVAGAGQRPDATASVWFRRLDRNSGVFGNISSDGDPRRIVVKLPPGAVGNPEALAKCPAGANLHNVPVVCPPESQVGILSLKLGILPAYAVPIYNVEPRDGKVAEFIISAGLGGFVTNVPIVARVRTAGDFGVDGLALDLPAGIPLSGQTITLWAVPWAAEHDRYRAPEGYQGASIGGSFLRGMPVTGLEGGSDGFGNSQEPQPYDPSWGPIRPFFSNPTADATGGCDASEPPSTRIESAMWQAPFTEIEAEIEAAPLTDCGALEFEPSLEGKPTTNIADSPSGFEVELTIPQGQDPEGRATAHLKRTEVTLPEGLLLNPSAANGLAACSSAEIGLTTTSGEMPAPIRFDEDDPSDGQGHDCPAAAKIATVEVETPLLEEADWPSGEVYLAAPHDNPFDSLLAIYIAVRSPERGFIAKLAGEVSADPDTGRLTATFDHSPQLPFERFSLHFKQGPRAALRTPATCGTHATASKLRSWAQPGIDVPSEDPWQIVAGPGGAPCQSAESSLPHAPGFDAGSTELLAGRHSSFAIDLRRDDATQQFSQLTLSPPPGLVAKLAGTPYCPEGALAAAAARDGRDEQASPSCPAASRVGQVQAAAGAGPAPFWARGDAYLAGPYKGAPLSLAVIAPAVAGPFDLGTIVVRTALRVDPTSAQITAVADPIPRILQGIVLDVREVRVRLDKPQFVLNPTDCEPKQLSGALISTLGQSAALASPFQVAECARLGFRPRMSLRLFGGVRRGKHQGLRAVVRPRPGQANISRAVVRMPRSAFLAQEHIRTVCTRVQFAADACPKGSIYGSAIAHSPLLDFPLKGAVYLRSSSNPLPDLVADLRGPAHQPIRIELVGRTDSVKGALRNTFDTAPDAPVSYFRLNLFGAKKGLIVNSRNICRAKNRAGVRLDAHNGRRQLLRPAVVNPKCKKVRRKAKRRAAKRRAAQKRRARR